MKKAIYFVKVVVDPIGIKEYLPVEVSYDPFWISPEDLIDKITVAVSEKLHVKPNLLTFENISKLT